MKGSRELKIPVIHPTCPNPPTGRVEDNVEVGIPLWGHRLANRRASSVQTVSSRPTVNVTLRYEQRWGLYDFGQREIGKNTTITYAFVLMTPPTSIRKAT